MRISLLLLALAIIASTSFAQPVTAFQNETGHNTSACSNDNTQIYCLGGFPLGVGPWHGGWADNRADVVTRVINPGVGDYRSRYSGNVSKGRGGSGDIHRLLYPGSTTKVFAVLQNWFATCPAGAPQVMWDPPLTPAECSGIGQTVDANAQYGHKLTGYSVNDPAYVKAAADDLWERGFDGVVAFMASRFACASVPLASGLYSGQPDNFVACPPGNALTWVEEAFQKLQQSMLRYPAEKFQFSIMYSGTFDIPLACACKSAKCDYVDPDDIANGPSDYFQAQCIRDDIRAQLSYFAKGCPSPACPAAVAETPYFASPNYLTPAPNSPVVQLFFNGGSLLEQCTVQQPCVLDANTDPPMTCTSSTDCWNAIWKDVRNYAATQLNITPYFIFRGAQPGLDSSPDGQYLWTQPNKYLATGSHPQERIDLQLDWGRTTVAAHYQAWSHTTPPPGKRRPLFFGAAWKGVDDRFWGPGGEKPAGLITAQRCGQTWLDTFTEPEEFFGQGNQLSWLIVPTYDDHEAGTQFQTGIDNCASVGASIREADLTWQTTFTDKVYGSARTLDHYRLFDSPDGASVNVLSDDIQPALSGSLDISHLKLSPGSHVLYLKLVGKPGIFNKISDPMPVYTVSLTKTGAGTVNATVGALTCVLGCSSAMAVLGAGAQVALTAVPSPFGKFAGWSGDCSGTQRTCVVTVDAARNVVAGF